MNITFGVANGPWEVVRVLGKGGPSIHEAGSHNSQAEGTWGAACNTAVVPSGDVAITSDYTRNPDWATRDGLRGSERQNEGRSGKCIEIID